MLNRLNASIAQQFFNILPQLFSISHRQFHSDSEACC